MEATIFVGESGIFPEQAAIISSLPPLNATPTLIQSPKIDGSGGDYRP